jgi:hypothetical protein
MGASWWLSYWGRAATDLFPKLKLVRCAAIAAEKASLPYVLTLATRITSLSVSASADTALATATATAPALLAALFLLILEVLVVDLTHTLNDILL